MQAIHQRCLLQCGHECNECQGSVKNVYVCEQTCARLRPSACADVNCIPLTALRAALQDDGTCTTYPDYGRDGHAIGRDHLVSHFAQLGPDSTRLNSNSPSASASKVHNLSVNLYCQDLHQVDDPEQLNK